MWLNPDYAPRLLWDTSMGQDSSKGAEVRDVMAKAFKVRKDGRLILGCVARVPPVVCGTFCGQVTKLRFSYAWV